jgi:cation diffusion facilitator family transporter
VSVVALVGNLVLFAVKMLVGALSGSIAVVTDSINNLLDSASGVIAFMSFKVSGKRRDTNHPHGHGRIEYLAGLVVAIIIVMTSVVMGYFSIWKIISPQPIYGNWWFVATIAVTIVGKGVLAAFYFVENRKLKSTVLDAAGKDSVSDMLATTVTLMALVMAPVTDFGVVGVAGIVVSVFILVLGMRSFMAAAQLIVGYKPERGLTSQIRKAVLSYSSFAKIEKLSLHDYGPASREAVILVVLKRGARTKDIERDIREAKRELMGEHAVKAVIYWAP